MNNDKVNWHGSFVAVVTPFDDGGAIDEAAFRSNIEFLLDGGADGIVVSGCTGESWALSIDERLRLFRAAVETVGGTVPVIGGTGGVSTDGVIALSTAAKHAGCDGVMVLPPYYCMLGPREVVEHYDAISRGAQVPILLYNIPRRTGVNLSPELLSRIVESEWVVAIKESSNDFIQTEATVVAVGDRITVFTGHSAERAVPGLLMGCKGFVSSMESQTFGAPAIQMYDLVHAGRIDEARAIQQRTLTLDIAMRKIGTFPANLKAAMNVLGRRGGVPRRPLLALVDDEVARVAEVLANHGLRAVAYQ